MRSDILRGIPFRSQEMDGEGIPPVTLQSIVTGLPAFT